MKTLEDQEAELYEDFVERYYETGAAEVPGSWPPGLRERCLFFLKVVEGGSGAVGSRSVLAALGAGGVRAALTLAGPEPLPAQELSSGPERYVLEREIGRGGMGRVLLAYDRDLRRRVAMKVLRDGAGSPLRASRFLEEAQATSQLEHPNIAPVYDVGIDPSGAPFFTMKWVRGRDLEEVLRSGAGDASAIRLVQILQQAAMGVDFAHSRGVVHRDLKPQNVMVGDYGEVHVVDWGLAKVLRRAEAAAERAEGPERGGTAGDAVATGRPAGLLTLNGTVLGSVAYMAPEQARGDVRSVDPRTDVFGLGAILYRILTGQAPYPESDIAAALARARRGDVTPPSVAAPDRSFPGELERICRKALAARPED
ncbi:MAG: serine/threonine protein kinase, partial [Planctomycetes bacterium]|nr:serine/threonine protein kinase [Planctomycetota bacterium]